MESGSELLARILRQRRIEWKGRGRYKEPVALRLTDLPVLPKNWAWASLDQLLLNITDGDHQPPPQTGYGVPFLVIGNVRYGKIEFAGSRFVSRAYADAVDPFRKPAKGDILYSLVGSYGIAIKVMGDEEFCIQRHLAVLRPHSRSPVGFLALTLNSLGVFQQATSVATGTAQKTVPLAGLRQFAVPLPPLDEQQRLVAEIEKQFTRLEVGVTALRQVQAKLKRYRAAVLKAACEGRLVPTKAEKWRVGRLGDVLLNIEAGKSFKCEERPPNAAEIGVVKVSAVTWGTFNELESKTCLDPSRIEARYLIHPGDFLFSRANTIELIGACVIAGQVTLKVMLSDKILRFRFSDEAASEWVLYWLRSEYGRGEIERLATGNQESMRNIGQDRIRQIAMKFPPLAEQTRIVAEVERRLSVVEELEATVAANLRRAARLRQSILQRAFSGRL